MTDKLEQQAREFIKSQQIASPNSGKELQFPESVAVVLMAAFARSLPSERKLRFAETVMKEITFGCEHDEGDDCSLGFERIHEALKAIQEDK